MENKKINFLHFETIDSTNKYALENDELEHLTVVTADCQTQGQGRMGRSFFSPQSGLYMSVVFDAKKINCSLSLCTPAAGVAVREELEKFGIENIKIKWVNDLLLNGKKVGGILTRAKSGKYGIEKIIIGIGLNLTEPENGFPDDIQNKAGSLNFYGNKNVLAKNIALTTEKYIVGTDEKILSQYRKNLAFIGDEREITDYADSNRKITGVVTGVDERGFIIIKDREGKKKIISSGEIT